jgi:Skp family chaperone for outer membrane proteins
MYQLFGFFGSSQPSCEFGIVAFALAMGQALQRVQSGAKHALIPQLARYSTVSATTSISMDAHNAGVAAAVAAALEAQLKGQQALTNALTKAQREAQQAQRDAQREAQQAQRDAQREAQQALTNALTKAQREAQQAQRESQREAQQALAKVWTDAMQKSVATAEKNKMKESELRHQLTLLETDFCKFKTTQAVRIFLGKSMQEGLQRSTVN